MNFHRITLFRAVARYGSFSRAAQALNTSQPNVSKHIARLESELGVPLFHRLGGGIELTDAGRIVLDYARQAARLSEGMKRALDELLGLERGTLRLGASSIPGLYLLPAVVAAFQARNPKLQIELDISNSDRTFEGVLAGELDLGFVGRRIEVPGVQIQPYAEDELIMIAAPGHGLAGRASISMDDLQRETFILREQGSGTRHAMEELLRQRGIAPYRTLELSGCEAVKCAVAVGLGLSLISRRAIELELALEALVILEEPRLRVARQLYLIARKDIRHSTAALAFMAFLGKVPH